MNTLIAIGLGGAAGAIARYLISGWIYNRWGGMFPLGTFAVNMAGSFVLGFLAVYFSQRTLISPAVKMMITVGILGSLTTFSTFSFETVKLLQLSMWKTAFFNMAVSVVSGVIFAWAGAVLAGKV